MLTNCSRSNVTALLLLATVTLITLVDLRVHGQRGACYTRSYRSVLQTRTTQGSYSYSASCGWRGWRRCGRTAYHTNYQNYYTSASVSNFGCCSGYRQVDSSCTPICDPSCRNGGTCTSPFTCSCPVGQWNGSYCQTPICDPGCRNGGQCTGPSNCDCPVGWTGRLCQTDVNECAANIDGCNHMCNNTEGSFYCYCRDGFNLGPDERTCDDNNECLVDNGGCDQVCNNKDGSYSCSCRSGYEFIGIDNANDPINAGRECEDANECDLQNGNCDHICTNNIGSYECSCEDGYLLESDDRMCADVNECETGQHNCTGLASCVNEIGFFRCSCPIGYRLDDTFSTCADIDECEEGISGCSQECTNNVGSFVCSCNIGYMLESDEKSCTDIDECAEDVSDSLCNHICVNTIGSYECDCHRGFTLSDDGMKCSPRACPTLTAPQNGTITKCSLTSQTTGAECRFSCDDGFELTGSSSRFCRPSGLWSGSAAICQPLTCERLEPPENGAILPPCNQEFGSSCTILCNFGYELESATSSSHQTCVLNIPGGTMVEWTEPPTCIEVDPCASNPCEHGGVCTNLASEALNEVTFQCDCEGTGFEGPTCNRGILSIPEIPRLEEGEETSFELSAATDMEIEIDFDSSSRRLNVAPLRATLSPRKSTAQFNVTGSRAGQYSLGYNLRGPGSSIFDPPGQSPILVGSKRQESEVNRYFTLLKNEVGTITESCCQPSMLAYQECPMTTDRVEFLSSCRWTEENPRFESNGIVFARFSGLSVPVSTIGISIDYSEGSVATSISSELCRSCPDNGKNSNILHFNVSTYPEIKSCYFLPFSAGDTEDLIVSRSLARTYADRIRPLFPPWIALSIPTARALTSEVFQTIDYFSNLAEQEDVASIEGCEHIVTDDPGLYSVLKYNWLFQVSLDDAAFVYSPKSTQPVCLAINICQAKESPVYVSVPFDLQSSIKTLPVLRPYVTQDWSFSIDSVTLYNTSRSTTVSGSYWNGVSLYNPELPDADLRIGTIASIAYSSMPQSLVHIQLDITSGSLLYHFNNADERNGLLEGNTILRLEPQISGTHNTLVLSSSVPAVIHTSGVETGVCSQGVSLKMTYIPRIGQEFFSRLFSLEDDTPQCDMDVFVNIDHSLEFHGLSVYMNEGCPRLQLDHFLFSQMTHILYFSESSQFNTQCVQQTNTDLGILNPVLNVRSSLRNIPRLPLGNFMTLLPGPESVALSISYSADEPGYSAQMHSVNVSLLGTVITTPVDVRNGEISFTSEANLFDEYPADLTVTAATNVPWNRIILSVSGKMDESFQQNVENYFQNYVENEIITSALRRQRNADMVVENAKENLEIKKMELDAREKKFIKANESHSEAMQKVMDANAKLARAQNVINTANTDIDNAQRALGSICEEDDCEDIRNEIKESKTCDVYEEVEVMGQCTELEPRMINVTEIVDYQQVERWRYFTECYSYCYTVCFIFRSSRRCGNSCRGVCRRVTESEPIWDVVERTYFEPVNRSCILKALRLTSSSPCCESYIQFTPNVACIQGCRMQKQLAIEKLEESRQDVAEPFIALDNARQELVAARTALSQAAVQRENALRMRDQAIPPYESAQTVQELSIQNRMELLSQIENELKLAEQFEMQENNIEQVFRLTCVSFNTEIATESPLSIPLVLEYESSTLGRSIEKTVVFDFTSSFELNMRGITEEIVDDLLNATSRLARRSVPRITKRQVLDEDVQIRERNQNEVNFEKNCVDLSNAKSFISMISSNLMKINDSIEAAKTTLEESLKNLTTRLNIDPNEFFTLVDFDSLEALFNVSNTETDVSEMLDNDQLILQYKQYIQDLIEITKNASDAVDESSFSEWQASMEMLHNESKSAAGYPCTGFADCLEVVIELTKRVIEDLGAQDEKQALLDELKQVEVNFMKLATAMDVSIPEALSYSMQMESVINTDILSVYWCSKPPNITMSPPIQLNISSGSDLELTCLAESELPTKYHWSKDNVPIPNADSDTLVITDVRRMDGGNYTCHVSNAVGRDESLRSSVLVYTLPTFFLELSPVVTYAGNESGAYFACNASSYPYPGWRWYHRPTEEDEWELIEGEDTNELTVSSPQKDHEGWYTCEAFNYHGALRANPARLTILPVTVSQLSIGVEFQLASVSVLEDQCSTSLIESVREFMENRIKLGSASLSEVTATRNEIGYLISFDLISQNVTDENTPFMILSEIENIALPSRGDVSKARETLQAVFLSEAMDISFFCDDIQLTPQPSSLTFNKITYVCPSGQELHSNFLICVGCAQGTYQGTREAQRVFEGEGVNERFPVCKPCSVSMYEDRIGSIQCKHCPDFHQTRGTGSTSQEECYVDPLLFECSTSGTSNHITIDCKSNRPPSTTMCSFDGGLEHECKWPLIINQQSSISTGNHSVVLTIRDTFNHVAQQTVHYFLGEPEEDDSNTRLRPSLPQLGIQLINDTPRVSENTVEVDFILTRPASSVTCQLGNEQQQDCSSGSFIYTDLTPGRYYVRIQASNAKEDRAIVRRSFEIPKDSNYCTLHLVNDGITVSEESVVIEFAGVGPAESFECQLDKETSFICTSPVELKDIITQRGEHRIRITPQGCPGQRRRLTYKFTF